MSVYVDNAGLSYGRMSMCHMIADTTGELNAMADAIGVQRKWIQYPGTKREHYDICTSRRRRAVKLGAIEITSRQLVGIIYKANAINVLGASTDVDIWL